jgi:hypothetical protein
MKSNDTSRPCGGSGSQNVAFFAGSKVADFVKRSILIIRVQKPLGSPAEQL